LQVLSAMSSLQEGYLREQEKNDLKNSLDKLDDSAYVVEEMIASPAYPDPVGTYWKGSLTPKSTTDIQQINKIINYRGVSIYRIQNGKW
jgi:hypothetical protein